MWGTDNLTSADSNQTTNWSVRALGIEEAAVLDLISPPTGAHLLSGLGDVNGFRHDDLSVSPRQGMFTNPMFGNTESLDFAQSNPSIIVRIGNGQPGKRGAYSLDGGMTWSPFASNPSLGRRSIGKIAVSADGGTIVWSPATGTPFYSRDFGTTWNSCMGIFKNLFVISDRVNSSKFYAFDGNTGDIYMSTDTGINFSVISTNLPIGQGQLQAVPNREGDLWLAGNANGIYRSINSGQSFMKLSSVQEASAIGFGKPKPGKSFSAVYMVGKVNNIKGVFRSDDEGKTWVRINDDHHQYGWIGRTVIGDPRIYGRVYLGTNGRGILYADPVQAAQ